MNLDQILNISAISILGICSIVLMGILYLSNAAAPCAIFVFMCLFVTFVLPVLIVLMAIKLVVRFYKNRKSGLPHAQDPQAASGPAADRLKAVFLEEKERSSAINKVALVQYIEESIRAGRQRSGIASALKAKGWPENDVEEAFRSYKVLFGEADK